MLESVKRITSAQTLCGSVGGSKPLAQGYLTRVGYTKLLDFIASSCPTGRDVRKQCYDTFDLIVMFFSARSRYELNHAYPWIDE